MNRRARLTLILPLLILGIGTLVAPLEAQYGSGRQGRGRGPGRGGPGMGAIFAQLDLTAEQESAIDTIRSQYQPELEAARETSRTRRETLFDLAHAESMDEAAIREQGAQLGMAEAETMILMSRMRQEVHNVLTEEQLAELEELKETRGPKGRGSRGPRGPRSGQRSEPSEN